ncbi:GGDEF domain-containing protein [Azohydromonas lata]|uniref:diguanylate cyclase n=1 Tax=Azohydromonas lata TaxID=45677 RepID=A0ABU5IHB9_9BURK|nr:GGDEF domain-containing protein [Azohydromonas lata]MDZ5457911.1 GGDEF domain-containing protein [Azohydromonas lata]
MQARTPSERSRRQRWSRLLLGLGPRRSALLLLLPSVAACESLAWGTQMALGGTAGWAPLLLAAGLCGVLPPLLALPLLQQLRQLEKQNLALEVRATRDELTGAFNRDWFMHVSEREFSRSRRYDADCALLMVDADRFRNINDRYGRTCGDALLREIVQASGRQLRSPDLLARFSGESVAVLLPQTDPLGALDVAERIRETIAALQVSWNGAAVGTTVSVGVASLGVGHATLESLISDADGALHAAKEAGRNCVRAAPIQPRRSGEAYPVISK